MELSIIIPAYNEEKRLPPTLNRVIMHLKERYSGSYEIMVVDDGSRDNTAKVVERYRDKYPQVRLLKMGQNQGYGSAVRAGMLKSDAEYLLTMDADGSVNEEAILRFLEYMKKNLDIAMAVGSRTIADAEIVTKQPIMRVILGNVFLLLACVLFGWPMQDRINGFKMFRKVAARDVFRYQQENGFLGAAEIVYIIERRGWKYKLLPITWTDYRDSRVRPFRESFRSFLGMFKILVRDWKGMYIEK